MDGSNAAAAAAASFIMPLKLMMVSFEQAFTENWLALKSFEKKSDYETLAFSSSSASVLGRKRKHFHSFSLVD